MHLRTRKLGSSSECSISVPCISSAVLAVQVPWELLPSHWTVPWLWSAPQHTENMERGNPRTAVDSKPFTELSEARIPLWNRRGRFGWVLFWCCIVTGESLKAVAEMSHSPDLSYVRRAPLRSVRLWVSHLIYLLSCLSAGLSAKDWAAELTRKLQQLKLSLRPAQGSPPCLISKGECQGNCLSCLAVCKNSCLGCILFFLLGKKHISICLVRIYPLWDLPFTLTLTRINHWDQKLLVRSQQAHTVWLCPSPTETRWQPSFELKRGKSWFLMKFTMNKNY